MFSFSKLLLGKYDISFFRCGNCLCLESEPPYWLDEAYGGQRALPDIGMASRTLQLQCLVFFMSKVLRLSRTAKVLDWGGGNGLLVRLLRDIGLDAHVFDTYARNFYAVGFERQESTSYDLITAFEVWEHFVDPSTELEGFFSRSPAHILISTGLYENQGDEWNYLTPLSGRHVFFYSAAGRDFVARRFGYQLTGRGGLSLFSKLALSKWQRICVQFLFSRRGALLARMAFNLIPKDRRLIAADRALAQTYIADQGRIGEINWP